MVSLISTYFPTFIILFCIKRVLIFCSYSFTFLLITDKLMHSKESNSSLEKTEDTFRQLSQGQKSFSSFQQQSQKSEELKYSGRQDDFRSPLAHKDGGFVCKDDKQIDKLRSVGKEMVKIIGRKILSGELNLTKISFPIKACSPRTALQNSVQPCALFPHFVNRAATCTDSLERFKLSVVALLSSMSYIDMFLKPLNPIIGQTLQASLKDGTKLYCEQISHHPPISYFLVCGPNQSYRFSGYYNFEVSPGLNSLSLKNKGQRKFTFNDGTQIQATYAAGTFNNTFIGTSRIQEQGEFEVVDKKNGYSMTIQFGKVKKKSSDYFRSFIKKDKQVMDEVYGTYCGYIEIGKCRYWDYRDFDAYQLDFENINEPQLMSDFKRRKDLILLNENKITEAQKAKQQLQQIQRNDEKLRKKHKNHHE